MCQTEIYSFFQELLNSDFTIFFSFLFLGTYKLQKNSGELKFEIDSIPSNIFESFAHPLIIYRAPNDLRYYNTATIDFVQKYFNINSSHEDVVSALLMEINTIPKESLTAFSYNINGIKIEAFVNVTSLESGEKMVQIHNNDSNLTNKIQIDEQLLLQNSLDELSYIISHDLVEPVRTIRSFTQIIRKSHLDKLNDPEINEDFDFMIDASERLYNMIQGMLMYSRLSSKHFPHEQTDTLEVLVEVIKDLMAATNESNASIQCYNMPVVNFSKTLLVQIFSNLISNALKYKSDNRNPVIVVSAEDRGKEFLFKIQDNGIGIDNEQADRLFKIFQRLHPNDSKYPGTGMGLAICKKIIEREKGRIWFDGSPGVGTKFYFTLPKY